MIGTQSMNFEGMNEYIGNQGIPKGGKMAYCTILPKANLYGCI